MIQYNQSYVPTGKRNKWGEWCQPVVRRFALKSGGGIVDVHEHNVRILRSDNTPECAKEQATPRVIAIKFTGAMGWWIAPQEAGFKVMRGMIVDDVEFDVVVEAVDGLITKVHVLAADGMAPPMDIGLRNRLALEARRLLNTKQHGYLDMMRLAEELSAEPTPCAVPFEELVQAETPSTTQPAPIKKRVGGEPKDKRHSKHRTGGSDEPQFEAPTGVRRVHGSGESPADRARRLAAERAARQFAQTHGV